MFDGISLGESLPFGNLLQSPPDDFDGLSVFLVFRLGGEPNFLSFGLVKAHIGVVRFIVGAGQEPDEQGLTLVAATDAEGVMGSLPVVHGEDGPSGGEELGSLDVVHCGNTIKEPPEFVKRFPLEIHRRFTSRNSCNQLQSHRLHGSPPPSETNNPNNGNRESYSNRSGRPS